MAGSLTLATTFVSAASQSSEMGADSYPQLETVLQELYDRGRAAWRDFEVTGESFATHLARVACDEELLATLRRTQAEDVYLALAAFEGDDAAIRHICTTHLAEVCKALPRSGSQHSEAELVQLLTAHLFVASEGRPARIGSYLGLGSLRSWVRVIAVRTTVDQKRKSKPIELLDEEQLARVASVDDDPELSYLKSHYRAAFKTAFHEALAQLSPRQRNLLRYHSQGLGIDEIGALYGSHRATAARWLAKARDELFRKTRTILTRALGGDRSEFDSVMRLIESHLDTSLQRVLDAAVEAEETD